MAAIRKENVRQLILDATLSLLEKESLQSITLEKIAKTAGVSKGTIYYHFKTKEDIVFAIMDAYLDEQYIDLKTWIEDKSKDTSLPRLIKYILLRDTSATFMRHHFFTEAINGNTTFQEKLIARYEKFAKEIQALIKERTDLVDSEYASWLVLIISDGLLLHKLLGNPYIDSDAFIKQTEDYIKKLTTLESNK